MVSSVSGDRSVSGSALELAKLAGPVRIRSVTRRPSPIGRGAGLRNLAVGVRVPGTVPMESEPDRDRASLLTTARLAPWCSSHPFSSEDEPVRRLAPAGKRAAVRAVAFESPVFLHPLPVHTGPGSRLRNENPPGAGAAPKAAGCESSGGRDLLVPRNGSQTCRAAGSGLNPDGRASVGGRDLCAPLASTQRVKGTP